MGRAEPPRETSASLLLKCLKLFSELDMELSRFTRLEAALRQQHSDERQDREDNGVGFGKEIIGRLHSIDENI